MSNTRALVQVSASFANPKELFEWLKKYGDSSDEQYIYKDEFAFTSFPGQECDALLVFNTPSDKIQTHCYPERLLAFMMEPGIKNLHPYMFRDLDQYASVYSPLANSKNTVQSHGFLGWYLRQDCETLQQLPIPEKTKMISCIASGLKQLRGHRLRLSFVNKLKAAMPGVDFYGKQNQSLPDKIDGLLPYRYSIAIENAAKPYYFTEKINDCFLAWTVPLYYGCRNIKKFFPGKSFIEIDIHRPQIAIRQVKDIIESDDWSSRLDALQEARELVLKKYQPLAGAVTILNEIPVSKRTLLEINPVKQTLTDRIKSLFYQLLDLQ